jgi:predicted transposase/invertase (TIGR01784 family)
MNQEPTDTQLQRDDAEKDSLDFSEVPYLSPEDEEEFREVERRGMLPKEIDRFGDHFLKFLLVGPKRKVLFLDLINTILKLMDYEALVDIEPMDRELSPDIAGGRGLRLDYFGRTAEGKIVNVEFQNHGGDEFIRRALFCAGTLIHRQLRGGNDFNALCQTIFVGLLNFKLFDWDGWYWDFVLSNVKTRKILTKDLLLVFVEMKKLESIIPELRKRAKRGEMNESDLRTRLALWGGYMTGMGVDVVAEVMEKDAVFAEVLKAEQNFWGDQRNRFLQWRDEKRHFDALSELRSAERRGEARGEARGEKKERLKVALSLLAENAPFDLIQRVTGLSKDEIL